MKFLFLLLCACTPVSSNNTQTKAQCFKNKGVYFLESNTNSFCVYENPLMQEM